MKLKSLQDLATVKITTGPNIQARTVETKPKFHVDVLTFGAERAMLEYILTLLKKAFPGIITDMNFNSDGAGWRLSVEILYGRAQEYVDFLKKYNLLDRSLRVGLEESQQIEHGRKSIEI